MAWVSTTRVDNTLGRTALRQTLFAVDGSYSSSMFDQYEAEARAEVVAHLQYAGYASPGLTLTAGSDAEAFLCARVEALMLSRAFGQAKAISWPPGLKESAEKLIQSLQEIRDKQLPVPGMQPATADGYGGNRFSPTSGDSARASVFNLRGTSF